MLHTGGPAFPIEKPPFHNGMSLRDYFAAKAMQGLVALPEVDMSHDDYARWAYRQADAMLEARQKK